MGCCNTKNDALDGKDVTLELNDGGDVDPKPLAASTDSAAAKHGNAAQAAGEPPAAAEPVTAAGVRKSAPPHLAASEPARQAIRDSLPPRLLLGISIEGMQQYIDAMPKDVVQQCNSGIPTNAQGEPLYPTNDALNGYVNQLHIATESEADGLSVCERLQEQGSSHVGEATVFVSWFLATPLATLLDALGEYLRQHPELPRDTKFWVCDFVIRQATRQMKKEDNDVKKLGECVRAVGHTVLLMEPWHDPQPLRRAYCIKEVYHTQAGGSEFDVVMSSVQQRAFEEALQKDFESIATAMSRVDVQTVRPR